MHLTAFSSGISEKKDLVKMLKYIFFFICLHEKQIIVFNGPLTLDEMDKVEGQRETLFCYYLYWGNQPYGMIQ